MRTTLVVRDGLSQVVLHPETRAERAVLDLLHGDYTVVVHRAQFSETHGGYVREFGSRGTSPFEAPAHLPDTVLVLRPTDHSDVAPAPELVDHLRETLRLIRDQYILNRGDMSDNATLQAIKKICTEALGDGS